MKRSKGRALDGMLLLDKPIGFSSNQALQTARRIFDARKAGHTGNLDVLASGLLPICFGEATKFSAYLLDARKRYAAEVTLGYVSATGDAEGERAIGGLVPPLTQEGLAVLLSGFVGETSQVPPMYSALKHCGQPLYRLARQGIEIPRAERRITIHSLDLLAFDAGRLWLQVDCSKGTYIRTLAEDIGARLGCGAYLSALKRLSVGPFTIESAWTLADLQAKGPSRENLDACLLAVDAAMTHIPVIELTVENAAKVRSGQAVILAKPPASTGMVRIYDPAAQFLGLGQVLDDGWLKPQRLVHADPQQ